MAKLFRKYRIRTLLKNKFSKYLLYAIGEIFLVVIGILIALKVNNYNESLIKENTVSIYLENFVEDLKKDQDVMRNVIITHSFRFHSMQYLLSQVGEDIYDPTNDEIFMPEYIPSDIWAKEIPENYDREFINLAFLWTHRSTTQNLNTSTLDELKSIGIFSFIDNHELKTAINEYYEYWSHRLGDQNQSKFYAQIDEWESSLGQEGLFTSMFSELDDPLYVIRENNSRIYLLKKLIRESAWIVEVANGVIDFSQGLTEYIEDSYL